MNPADAVILKLVRNDREKASADDRSKIVARMAAAPFPLERHTAAEWCRMGTDVVGTRHPSRQGETIASDTPLTTCEVHVAKRVLEGRWAPSTTPAEYVDDLHSAAGHAEARLHIGEKPPSDIGSGSGQRVAATLTHMGAPGLSLKKVNRKPGYALFVVYDADKSALSTGYTEPEYVVQNLVKRWKHHRVIAKGT